MFGKKNKNVNDETEEVVTKKKGFFFFLDQYVDDEEEEETEELAEVEDEQEETEEVNEPVKTANETIVEETTEDVVEKMTPVTEEASSDTVEMDVVEQVTEIEPSIEEIALSVSEVTLQQPALEQGDTLEMATVNNEEVDVTGVMNVSELEKTKVIDTATVQTTTDEEYEDEEDDEEYEDEDDDEYEYVTPHYFRTAFLLTLLFMIIGAGISYVMFNKQLSSEIRQSYIKAGYMTTKDATATAGDIAQGKTAYINGKLVTGTYVPLETSNATAMAGDILSGYTAYVKGNKVTGSIPTLKALSAYVPSTSNITIPKGYYIAEDIIIQGNANLIPGNIRAGIELFGVKGTYK